MNKNWKRTYPKILSKALEDYRVVLLTGSSGSGKSSILKYWAVYNKSILLNCKWPESARLLLEGGQQELLLRLENCRTLVLDEIQALDDPFTVLSLLFKQVSSKRLILCGNYGFLYNKSLQSLWPGELTKRRVFPLLWEEVEATLGAQTAYEQRDRFLRYGFYPEVLSEAGREELILRGILRANILSEMTYFLPNISRALLERLLLRLAQQVSGELKTDKLTRTIGINKQQLIQCLEYLEHADVIFRLDNYCRDKEDELEPAQKLYFVDNGVCNAILDDFRPMSQRLDKGGLWENFLVSGRLKHNRAHHTGFRHFYWRSPEQDEVDLLELGDNGLTAYEFKWSINRYTSLPLAFYRSHRAKSRIIGHRNFRSFLLGR